LTGRPKTPKLDWEEDAWQVRLKRECPPSRRRKFAALAPVLVAVGLVLSPACRKAESPSFSRLIDSLDRANILQSPLLGLAADPKGFGGQNPNLADLAPKFPILDAGVGPNPLLIKKKIPMGSVEDNALLAPPPSTLRFVLEVAPGTHLEFGCGIYGDPERSTGEDRDRSVDFSIRLKGAGPEVQLFQRLMTLAAGQELVSDTDRLDLSSYAGRRIALEFVTRGDRDSMALWFNPVLVRERPGARAVILISIDTLRADHLGCYGYKKDTSPNIDRLAADGVLFQNTFAPSPWTLPSHVSIFTGLDLLNHRVLRSEDVMDPGLPSLPDFFRARGFLTAAFTGGGFVSGHYGFSRGFDIFRTHGPFTRPDLAHLLAEDAMPWLWANGGRDFFLFLHTYQTHNPYTPPQGYGAPFLDPDAKRRRVNLWDFGRNLRNRYKPPPSEAFLRNVVGLYDGEIRYADEALIGRLVARLKKMGLYDRSLIILTSDHGEEFFDKGSWLHRNAVYNPTIKVPLVIKFPGLRDAGTRVDHYARLTDILPTILEEMGFDGPAGALDGKSLEPLIHGAERGPERVFRCELGAYLVDSRIPRKRTVNRGTYKVIVNDAYTPRDLAFFRRFPPPQERVEVYDLASDPLENRNLAPERPKLARELVEYLESLQVPSRAATRRSKEITKKVQEELKALGYIR
jgi:arylsulfatase A-like enzyme